LKVGISDILYKKEMKKVISLLLAVILISGCDKMLNKSQSEPAKTDTQQNANQPAPSPSPSPSPSSSPLPSPRPTSTPSPTKTPLPLAQSSFEFSTAAHVIAVAIPWTIVGIALSLCYWWCWKKAGEPPQAFWHGIYPYYEL
jgi:hypothetical protein